MSARSNVLSLLLYPFTTDSHPLMEEVQHWSVEWAHDHHLLATPAIQRRCVKARIGALAAYTSPTFDSAALRLAAAWCTWFTVLDDYDDLPQINTATMLPRMHARMLEVLAGAPLVHDDNAFVRGLADLSMTTRHYVQANEFERYIQHVADYFGACDREAFNRAHHTVPDRATYLAMRAISGGLYAYIELLCIVARFDHEHVIRSLPHASTLQKQAVMIIGLCNDLLSLERELLHNDVQNLVIVLERHEGMSRQQAWQETLEIHNQLMRDFMVLSDSFVQHADPHHQADCQHYVDMLRVLIRGSFDWACATARHVVEPLKEVAVSGQMPSPLYRS